MKIAEKVIFHKMGYKKGEQLEMEAKDIIELGKLGYTKDEIEEMRKAEPAVIPDDVQTQLNALTEKLDKLTADAKNAAARQTTSTSDPGGQTVSNVDDILLKMSGVENNG